MSHSVTFYVSGRPGPQGSKRHVGNGVMIESSKLVKPWREAVKFALLEVRDAEDPWTGPVSVDLTFCFPPPKSASKRKALLGPVTRSTGDLDKLCRSTLDAIVDAGLIADDSQVVRIRAFKCHYPRAGAMVTVEKVQPPPFDAFQLDFADWPKAGA